MEEQPARADVESGEALAGRAQALGIDEPLEAGEPLGLELGQARRQGVQALRRTPRRGELAQHRVERGAEARAVVGVEIVAEQGDDHGRRAGEGLEPLARVEFGEPALHRVGADADPPA